MDKRKIKKNKHVIKISMYIAIAIGTFLIAFGNTVFLTPLNINAGGLNGIGIIVMNFCPAEVQMIAYNIVIYAMQFLLWLVSFFLLGKEFALRTLFASILFPVATSIFTIVPGTKDFAISITNILMNFTGEPTTGTYMLFSIVGGVFVGFGVAVTLLGGGSSGGVDVIICIMEKYLGIKQSIGSFFCDFVVIVAGIIALCPNNAATFLMPCVVGVLSIVISALMIDIGYVAFQTVYQAEIISSKWEAISRYAQDELGRGVTIIPIKGGYKKEDKIMIRVVLSQIQYDDLKTYIAEIDDRAFITVSQTKMVLGEGFRKNKK